MAVAVSCLVAATACLPQSTVRPEIIGLPEVGHTLTAAPGTWTGGPTALAYTWRSCAADDGNDCVTRQQGAGTTYQVAPADAGRRIQLTVVGTNDIGSSSATSAFTAVVADGAVPSSAWRGWATSPNGEPSLRELAPAAETSTVELLVEPAEQHQEWLGVGAALTDSSASLMQAAGADLSRALFDPDDPSGAQLRLVRFPLSATDFSDVGWTWQDDPGGPFAPPANALDGLTVLYDLMGRNPDLQVVAGAWSAPAWMKDSGQLNGGALAAGVEQTYGEFLLSQANLLRASGIPLRAVTLGNEPGHSTSSYPTMTMSDEQMIAMAQAINGPLRDGGVELWALDHNWSDRGRLDNLLAGAPGAFDAAAFHCYSGEPESMGGLAVPAVVTECSGGSWDPSWASTFRWQARNLVVDAALHGSSGLLMWNLALDPSGGPHVGGCEGCRGVVTVDPSTGEWAPEPEFFLLAHVSRAAGPGATRTGLVGRPDIPSVAFANPDGTIGIFGHNDSGERQVLSVAFPAGDAARVVVEPGDLFSLRGAPLEGPPPEVDECAGRAATIVGTGGADTLAATGAADVIQALDGNDTITGVGLDDVVCAHAGQDRITIAPGAGGYGAGTVVHAGPGDDAVTVQRGSGDRPSRVTVHGGDGDDRLEGFHGDDLVEGEAGNDVLRAADGAVNRPTGQVRLVGGDGADELHSGLYATVLDGGPGDDRLRTHAGSTATPSLFGGAGDDDLVGGSGAEALDGGAGMDDTCAHASDVGTTFGCETATGLLGASGGTLTLDDGRGVPAMTVPAGALAGPCLATLRLVPTAPASPGDLVPVGSHVGMDLACEWEPPVQLTLPYEPAFVDEEATVQVGHHHDGSWDVLDGSVDAAAGRITVGLDSFSTAQPVAPRCGGCDALAKPFVMLERLLDLRSDPWCTHQNNVVQPDGSRVIVTGAPIGSATSPQSWHCVTRANGRSVVTFQPNRGMVSRYVTTGQPLSVQSISASSNLAGDTIALLSRLILDRSGNNLVPPGGRIAVAVDDGRAGTVLVQHAPFTTAGTLAFSIVGDVVSLAGLDISDVTRLTDVLVATSPECTASVSLDETSGGQKIADCLDTVITAVEALEASSGLSSLKANRVVQALDKVKGALKAVGKIALIATAGGTLIDAIRTPWEDGDVTVVAIPPGGAVLRRGGESWDVDTSGYRHHIPDTRVYACRAAAKPVIDVPAIGWNDTMQQLPVGEDAACVSGASARGRIVRAVDGTAYYVDRTGWRHWLRDGGVFECHGGWSNVIDGVHWDDISRIPEAEHAECFTGTSGDIIRHPDGDSYVLAGSGSALTRQHLPSAGAYTCARAEGRRVVTVTRYQVEEIDAGTPRPAENCLLRAPEGDAHFVNYEGRREWVPDSITWDCERGRGVRVIDTSRAFIESVSEVGWHYCLHKPSLHNEVLRHADGDAHFVHPDNTRTWIPDAPTWECRVRQGRPINDTRWREYVTAFTDTGWDYCFDAAVFRNKVLRHADGDAHYVHPDNTRTWIPDGATFACRTNRGTPVVDTRWREYVNNFTDTGWDYCYDINTLKGRIITHPEGDSHYVDNSGVRHWIPSQAIYNCLRSRGIPADIVRWREYITNTPEGSWATCS